MERPEATSQQRELMNAAYKAGLALGRKFDARDVTGSHVLAQAAHAFAGTYSGDFEYMLDMQKALGEFGWLTPNQAKGVLNCLMAEARRIQEAKARKDAPAPAAVEQAPAPAITDYASVMSGSYTVVLDAANRDDAVTLRISEWEDFTDRRTGRARADVRSVAYLAGPDNTADFRFAVAVDSNSQLFHSQAFGPRIQAALRILVAASNDDKAAMGAAYAFASSRCWRCHRELTVEDSVAGGIGPVCAKKVGRAYGKSVLEAAREAMARLQSAPVVAPVVAQPTAISTMEARYQELFGAA